ncbi:MAG: cobalamin-binding protein [Chloroflexi bacterium]|nr:cobalamin-binding protein [Chloroflexota bacterium]
MKKGTDLKSRFILVLASLALVVIMAACGSAGATGTPSATETATAAATETATAEATGTTTPEATATATVAATTETPTAAATEAASGTAAFPMTITDDAGRSVTFKTAPKAVVSLAPSNTEIVYALGQDSKLVGVSELDDYPPQVANKKKIGGGFQPNLEEIMALNPDLVLTIGEYPDLTTQLESKGLTVLVLGPKDLDGIYNDIEMVGKVLGAEDAATKLTADMRTRADAVEAKVKDAPKPKVFFEVDATDPTKPFTAGPGSFIDILIQAAGGENIAGKAATQWPQLSSEEIVAANPDIIVLGDASVPTNPQSPDTVAARAGWADIKAVKDKAVYGIDTNIVSRPGPRIVDGLEAVAKLLHPDLFK